MATTTSRFDAADHLKTPADVIDFIVAAFDEAADDDDASAITHALGTAAKANGMTRIAAEAGVTREALYKALSADGNPRFTTLVQVLRSFGLRLAVQPIGDPQAFEAGAEAA